MILEDSPQPLVPAEVDLRGYEFMPLFGDRLFASATWIGALPEARCAMLRLWWHSYAHEIPASSLPDDDVLLADYAGYGVVLKSWKKVRPQAMRGWIKCGDGRLYHPFLAECAIESWKMRQAHKMRTLAARIKALEKRLKESVTDQEKQHLEGLLQELRQGQLHSPTGQDRKGQDSDIKKEKALSGKPDAINGLKADSIEILEYLNRNSGRSFRAVDTNLELIAARLKSGVTPLQCREVVFAKCEEWKSDPVFSKYLRPETIFNRRKFEQYLGELGNG